MSITDMTVVRTRKETGFSEQTADRSPLDRQRRYLNGHERLARTAALQNGDARFQTAVDIGPGCLIISMICDPKLLFADPVTVKISPSPMSSG